MATQSLPVIATTIPPLIELGSDIFFLCFIHCSIFSPQFARNALYFETTVQTYLAASRFNWPFYYAINSFFLSFHRPCICTFLPPAVPSGHMTTPR
uniref:S.cerevisiae RAD51 protein (RAD51) protein n=1 Tax=Saccharomyces cerevisiae TaxID=4932 RepID=V9GZI9_YEASX|nr:ORF2 [Saccharomyces cerevisiae]